jgi:general nucleoside transport system permease protein
VIDFLLTTLHLWTPLVFVALGGVLAERSGVVTLCLEGMMLAGAFAAVFVGSLTQNPLLAPLAGVGAGAIVGLLHALFVQVLRVQSILSGVGLNLGVLGLTTYLLRIYGKESGLVTKVELSPTLLALLAVALVASLWYGLARTRAGVLIRTAGEKPEAALAIGTSVPKLRTLTLAIAGGLAGLGGVCLTLLGLGTFTQDMTDGRGYICVAAVIFGRWSPLGASLTVLLFALGDALQIELQTLGYAKVIPPDFLTLFPYLLTLIALLFSRKNGHTPAALSEG